jgi:glycosyltransferase involved in cell wall biosynthesis
MDHSLSIVIPVRNCAATIATQLDAIARQGRLPAQIVIADNGSTDDVVAHVTDWATTTSIEVTIIDASARRSANFARNRGREAAAGEWLLFLDGDDEIADGFIEEIVRRRARRSLVSGVFVRTDSMGQPVRGPNTAVAGRFYGVPQCHTCALLVHADDLAELGGFSELHPRKQDVELSLRALARGWAVLHVPAAVLYYHQRPSLRGQVKQAFLWAYNDPRLLAEFRESIALDRPTWRQVLQRSRAVGVRSTKRLLRRRDRGACIALAEEAGHLLGALRWRTPA